MNSLYHRNIVRLLTYGWDDGPVPYLVLEYADLGSLDHFLQNNKQLWAEKDRVLIGLASALELLHACEVIHGDIKLGNILVFANRKRGFDAKLADFGLSCSMALGQRVFRGTRVSNAPEIRCQTALVEDTAVYEKANVYSYRLALWEILNDGRHYF
ncbi:kinase-like domain-containing protein, partial [Rhexocercosporidium sp. MPI-PUGE-AT-0058]